MKDKILILVGILCIIAALLNLPDAIYKNIEEKKPIISSPHFKAIREANNKELHRSLVKKNHPKNCAVCGGQGWIWEGDTDTWCCYRIPCPIKSN